MNIDPVQQSTAHRRLNVGCGDFPLLYWTNLDESPLVQADLRNHVPPLPFGPSVLDEIYAGHFLEHLTEWEAHGFLSECYRCLVSGGRLGIVVPDTRIVMARYVAGTSSIIDCEGVHDVGDLDAICRLFLYSTVQGSPHKWSYDADTLARAIRNAGFRIDGPINRYTDRRIPVGAWYQCGWDAIKP